MVKHVLSLLITAIQTADPSDLYAISEQIDRIIMFVRDPGLSSPATAEKLGSLYRVANAVLGANPNPASRDLRLELHYHLSRCEAAGEIIDRDADAWVLDALENTCADYRAIRDYILESERQERLRIVSTTRLCRKTILSFLNRRLPEREMEIIAVRLLRRDRCAIEPLLKVLNNFSHLEEKVVPLVRRYAVV